MKDYIICEFSFQGDKALGIVLKHFTHPLNDCYIIYCSHAILEYHGKDDCIVLAKKAILPVYDDILTNYMLKKQHLEDITSKHTDIDSLLDAMRDNSISI